MWLWLSNESVVWGRDDYRGEDAKGVSLTMILHQFLPTTSRHKACIDQQLTVIEPVSFSLFLAVCDAYS